MATSFLKVLNRAFSTLDGAINNSVTTVNVAAGEGANFPATFDYHLKVGEEILKVTGRSTDALTVVRGAESTTPASHSDGDTIAMVITAQHLSDLNTAVNTQENFTALDRISGSTFSTLQHLQDIFHSAGLVSGGGITDDADGTISVAAGTGLIRDVDGVVETIFFTDWSAEAGANVALADNDINYVYVEWNSGSPQVVARTTVSTDFQTDILLAVIQRTGTTLHINVAKRHIVGDHANNMIQRLQETAPYARASGALIGATGTRAFAITAGDFWEGLTEFTTSAFDSDSGGAGDTFNYWYRKVSDSGWNAVATQSQIHQTQYDNNSGTLVDLSNNKYGVHWVYLETDDHVDVVYGQGDYTLSEAENAQAPSAVPEQIAVSGILVGKIIIKKSAAAFTEIESRYTSSFPASLATEHGALLGLADDDHTQYLLADGSRALAGAWNMGSQALTNVNVDSGTLNDIAAFAVVATIKMYLDGGGDTYIYEESPDDLHIVVGGSIFLQIDQALTPGSMAFGVGAAPSADVSWVFSQDRGNVAGGSDLGMSVSHAFHEATGNTSGTSHGIQSSVSVTASNDKNWTAAVGLRGYEAFIFTAGSSTGVITGAAGYYMRNPEENGATYTNVFGMYFETLSVGDNNYYFGFAASDTTANTGNEYGRIPVSVGGTLKYLRVYDD